MSLNIPCLVPGKQSKHIQIGQFPFHNVGSSRRFHRFGMALYSTRFYFTGICTNSLFAFRPILSNMSSLLATGNLINYSKIRDRAKVMQFLNWLYFVKYMVFWFQSLYLRWTTEHTLSYGIFCPKCTRQNLLHFPYPRSLYSFWVHHFDIYLVIEAWVLFLPPSHNPSCIILS